METSRPKRQRLFHAPPPWVRSGDVFFITICCRERGANSLAHQKTFEIIKSSLEHHILSENLWLRLVLAMPDHLHALASFSAAQPMEKLLRDWKRYTAKRANILWQDGFFDHRIRNEASLDEKSAYIRMNPVRAGLVTSISDWPYTWDPTQETR